jgi:hypothetical protein
LKFILARELVQPHRVSRTVLQISATKATNVRIALAACEYSGAVAPHRGEQTQLTGVCSSGVWEEAVTLILGVLCEISSWLLGFGDDSTPMTNAVVVGLLVMGFAVAATLTDPAARARLHLPRQTH